MSQDQKVNRPSLGKCDSEDPKKNCQNEFFSIHEVYRIGDLCVCLDCYKARQRKRASVIGVGTPMRVHL